MMDESKREIVAELIRRRRRQILVHSIIYYKYDMNLISDSTWSEWALELENLQKEYPEIAEEQPYADAFRNFDHSTGSTLPLDDLWGNRKARQLIEWQ